MKVIIRPLQEADAIKSFRWRNNEEIWRLTGNKPNKKITAKMELDWIREALTRSDEIRFAICAGETEEYIGNVQLTKITEMSAEFHIFIGELSFQNKGIGSKATKLMIDYSHERLGLKNIYLKVHLLNYSAIRAYIKCGFKFQKSKGMIATYIKKLPAKNER
jgi:RimJ/RimL family protein N-acetyltransferase